MIVVLDASGAAEISEKTQVGVDFINIIMQAEKVLAPDLYIAEIGNYMWKACRKDKDNADLYVEMAKDCIDYIDEFESAAELWREALQMAQAQDHAIYDMLYATLARRNDAILLTMDRKLRDICKKLSIRCKKPLSEVNE